MPFSVEDDLRHLVGRAYQEWGAHVLDAAADLDGGIHSRLQKGGLTDTQASLQRFMSSVTDEDTARQVLTRLDRHFELPEGTSSHEWLLNVRNRVDEVLKDPSVLIPPFVQPGDGLTPPRDGRFVLRSELDHLLTEAAAPYRDEIEAWLSVPAASNCQRLHIYADVATIVGVVGEVAPIVGERYQARPNWDRAIPVTAVALTIRRVLHRGEDTGTTEAFFARPEKVLDLAVRRKFPDLCHFYGGYFNRRIDENDDAYPMDWMRHAMCFTRGDARNRLRDQLTQLLTHPDDDMRYIVEQCGSYVLPTAIRHWVDRTLWRLDAYDWASIPMAPSRSDPLRRRLDDWPFR